MLLDVGFRVLTKSPQLSEEYRRWGESQPLFILRVTWSSQNLPMSHEPYFYCGQSENFYVHYFASYDNAKMRQEVKDHHKTAYSNSLRCGSRASLRVISFCPRSFERRKMCLH